MRRSCLVLCVLCWHIYNPQTALALSVNLLEKTVLRIIVRQHSGFSTGSGAVLNRQGDILTNYHVIEGGIEVAVASKDITGLNSATIIWTSAALDIAIINVQDLDLPAVTLTTKIPNKGDKVLAFGFPSASDYESFALDVTVTAGVLSRVFLSAWVGSSSARKLKILQHTAAINPGNSGGPLFDACGRVIGVNTQKRNSAEGVFFASGITEIFKALARNGIAFAQSNEPCNNEYAQATQQAKAAQQAANTAILEAASSKRELVQLQQQFMAWAIIIFTLSLVTLGLVLRKPRAKVVRVFEQISEPLARTFSATILRNKRPSTEQDIVLTGANAQGTPICIKIKAESMQAAAGGFTLGRHPLLVDYVIEESMLSKRHLRFAMEKGRLTLEDLNSRNGTTVNQTQLRPYKKADLHMGDRIGMGGMEFVVSKN